MKDLRGNQPTQYQRGKQTSELRGERIAPLKIEHHAESREQEEQMAENVPGERLLPSNSRLRQLALRASKPVFTAGKQADEVSKGVQHTPAALSPRRAHGTYHGM